MDRADNRSVKSNDFKTLSDDVETTKSIAYEALLQRKADVFAKRIEGSSLLDEALTGKYENAILSPIVERNWKEDALQARLQNEMGITMLHIACYAFDEEKLYELLKKGVSVNVRARKDSSIWPGYTPLHVLLSGCFKVEKESLPQTTVNLFIQYLLHKGADVTLTDTDGDTPVVMALKAQYADHGHSFAKRLLKLQRDFSVNPVNNDGLSHFHVTCFLNEVQVAKHFLKHVDGIDVNEAVGASEDSRFAGRTPLLLAFSARERNDHDAKAQVELVDLLLENGADVRFVDAFGYTPLHELAACASTRGILLDRLLIDNEDINRQTVDGKNILEILLLNKASSEEVEYLIGRGAQVHSNNPISGIGYMAIVLKMDKSDKSLNAKRMLEIIMDSPSISILSGNGIHNLLPIAGFMR